MKKMLLALVLFLGVAFTATPASAAPMAATYGSHYVGGVYRVGYYCPIGYRLSYGPYVTVGYYWNGFAYVYGAYTTYGYYCTWP